MVHYEDIFIEYPTAEMYSRTHYSPPAPGMFNVATSVVPNSTYDTPPYHNTAPPMDSVACTVPYYEQSYRSAYWPQTHTGKEDAAMAAYQQSSWTQYHARDNGEMYKQHPEYFTLQNSASGHNSLSQHSPGVGAQYAPCAVMSSMSQPQGMEEELAKERHSQGYNGWITSAVGSNCKTRTKDKYRVVYSDHQRLELEKEFHYSRYITIRRKAELASNLSLSERQVKIWFQNRRAKERKMSKKKTGDDVKSTTEAEPESRSSPCSEDSNDGASQGTPTHSIVL